MFDVDDFLELFCYWGVCGVLVEKKKFIEALFARTS